MLTVEGATREVLARALPLPPRRVALAEACDCELAEAVEADLDLPPFDKALVDGYAVRTSELAGGTGVLRLGEEITAGKVPTRPLAPGEAAAIMTGAPIPEGADAVVMVERTRRDGGSVLIEDPALAPGRNRLPRGREMRAGEVVLREGERLSPARLGLLASVGRTEVAVVPRPRVAIVPTGDELVEPDRRPGPGQIRNSNAVVLQSLARTQGAEADVLPIAPDRIDRLSEVLRRGLAADVLLITGGVSAGNRDLVPEALAGLGVERVFHKVRLKPGKPLWFGVAPPREERPGALVFGLPGNPVSGIVGFLLFVRPALDRLWALPCDGPRVGRGILTAPYPHSGDRPTYHPALLPGPLDGAGTERVEPLPWAGSADLRTVARADGFAIFPAGDRTYRAGEAVEYLRWS